MHKTTFEYQLFAFLRLTCIMRFLIHHLKILSRTYYPWPADKQCENFTTVFSKGQMLPAVALASNPNSGNTWLRYLIEGITGIFTGSFYGDIDLSRKGNCGLYVIHWRNYLASLVYVVCQGLKLFCRLLWRIYPIWLGANISHQGSWKHYKLRNHYGSNANDKWRRYTID